MTRSLVCGVVLMALIVASAAAGTASGVVDVTVEQARALVDRPKDDLVILDVRTPEEFAEGHVAGARNLNVMAPDFERQVAQLDRAKPYLVYCRTGNRSGRAVQIMTSLGFTRISHMTEGIVGWQAKRFPLVK